MLGWLGLDLQVFRPRPFPLIALLTWLPSAALRLADGDLRGILHVAAIWIGVIFFPAARDPHHRLLRRRLRRWSGRRCGGRRRRRSWGRRRGRSGRGRWRGSGGRNRSRCNHRRGGRRGVWSRTARESTIVPAKRKAAIRIFLIFISLSLQSFRNLQALSAVLWTGRPQSFELGAPGCSHIECDSVYRIRSDQCSAWQFHRRPYTYILHRFRWTDSEPCRRKLHLQYPIRRQPA